MIHSCGDIVPGKEGTRDTQVHAAINSTIRKTISCKFGVVSNTQEYMLRTTPISSRKALLFLVQFLGEVGHQPKLCTSMLEVLVPRPFDATVPMP